MPHIGEYIGPARVSGTVVPGTTSAETSLVANEGRTKLIFDNDSTEAFFIKFGLDDGDASASNFTIKLLSGTRHVEEVPMWTGSISIVQGPVGPESGSLFVTEFSKPEFVF